MSKKSHLYRFHKEKGKLTEFGGYEMPLWYGGILEEHRAVRDCAGLFDVSHMGRFWVEGTGATGFLDEALPSDVSKVKPMRAFYSTICNDDGGIVDDVVTLKISDQKYLMVVNAANIDKDFSWLDSRIKVSPSRSATLSNASEDSALIAVQGPKSQAILQRLTDIDLSAIKRFGVAKGRVSGEECLLSRTGYTGEDGFEIAILDTRVDNPLRAEKVWNSLIASGKSDGLMPCGLGARDLLRLEAGMCLYGQDIDDSTTPVEGSLSFVVSTSKQAEYPGRARIERQLREGPERKRVAFQMVGDGIPRHGYEVTMAGAPIGHVTSGSFSPILKKGIGMAYVSPAFSELGKSFSVRLRNLERPAEVVKTPFYDASKYGYSRDVGA
jgi:aminomethyltransferase